MLDPVGSIVEIYQFDGIMPAGNHDDYNENKPFRVRFSYERMTLESSF